MARITAILVIVAAAATAAAVALASSSPKALRAAMLKAASARHSVHYVSTSSTPGHSIRMVSDVGPGRGIQRITFADQGKRGRATVLVVGHTAYIRGNAFTLHVYFGFSKAQGARYGGKWISVPRTSAAYPTISADATFASFLAYLFPQRQLTLVRSTVDGRNVVGVRGLLHAQGVTVLDTVYAPANGAPLPAESRLVSPGHPGQGLATMSRWNEPVHVQAPAHAVPIATVLTS